jgi:hypothetical protein
MDSKACLVDVVILDRDEARSGSGLEFDTALTLVAVASEDPACWDDIVALWPRYRTPVVPEFASSLALEAVDRQTALSALRRGDSWIVIDLVRKRILTGPAIEPFGRDQVFEMSGDESMRQHFPLSIHLPPWWELFEQTDSGAIDRDRESPLLIPRTNRRVLFGKPLVEDLARRILEIAESDEWRSSGAKGDEHARYAFTIRVHRDWLMTPREDLGGLMPRQMLHGARDWIDWLVEAQRLRCHDGGEIVAAGTGHSIDDNEPMGGEEIVVYFDLCRELIDAGWEWYERSGTCLPDSADRLRREQELCQHLSNVQEMWLDSPFEGGAPPRFIIECSRRRVPRGVGVPIVGMSDRQPEQHILDCNCPLCIMMAEESFGPAFVGLDGHHLDLDDEFAFSMCETREEWEAQQREFAEMSAAIELKTGGSAADCETESEEFAPIWSGQGSDEPIPGDPQGHLRLAFMMAEMVGLLEAAGASPEDLRQVNECFSAWRHCDPAGLPACTREFAEHLEDLASRYPGLVSRIADFQSRLEEQVRASVLDD